VSESGREWASTQPSTPILIVALFADILVPEFLHQNPDLTPSYFWLGIILRGFGKHCQ
jgi:hypothetical protein